MAKHFEPNVVWRDPAELTPYAHNAKTHPDAQVDKIAASISEYGFDQPIVVDAEGVIIKGHGRLLAARRLGIPSIPVIVRDDLTPLQVKAARLMDNKSAESEWDLDELVIDIQSLQDEGYEGPLGFDEDEMAAMLTRGVEEPEGFAGENEVPEPPADPVTKPGDLWILGDHRLLCGDSGNVDHVRRLMNGERAILFATDPPYLVDYDGKNHPGKKDAPVRPSKNTDWSDTYGITWDDASQGPDLYRGFIATAIAEAIDPHAAWYCWHASRRQAMLEAVWVELGAFVHQQIIWAKDRPVLTRSHYLWAHEPCLFGWIKGNKPPKVSEDYLNTVWRIASLDGEERPDHPTPKPLDCFAIPMKQHVAPGGLCYEPFSGSGSQIVAGEATGRRVNALEISPAYVDVAVLRWQGATGKAAVLDGDGRTFDEIFQAKGR